MLQTLFCLEQVKENNKVCRFLHRRIFKKNLNQSPSTPQIVAPLHITFELKYVEAEHVAPAARSWLAAVHLPVARFYRVRLPSPHLYNLWIDIHTHAATSATE